MTTTKDPYVYPGSHTLKNKHNVTNYEEADSLENDLSLLRIKEIEIKKSNPIKGKFDYQHLKDIHKYLFQDTYEWAGQPRTIGMSKREPLLDGRSVTYPHPNNPFPPEKLDARAQYAFKS